MGRIIQVPDEEFVRKALIEAEDRLRARTGRRFSLMLDRADESVLGLSALRDDGTVAEFIDSVPDRLWFTKAPRDHVHAWMVGRIDQFVGALVVDTVEVEPAPQAEPEQRFAVVLAFGSRPDVVLTPAAGVPADEAVRVYAAFLGGAEAIGGRPAMLPLGA